MTTNLRTYLGAGVGADKAVVENLDLVSRVNIYGFNCVIPLTTFKLQVIYPNILQRDC